MSFPREAAQGLCMRASEESSIKPQESIQLLRVRINSKRPSESLARVETGRATGFNVF